MIVKDDEYYKKELSEDIMKIMLADRNKESYAKFQETIKDLKPKKCVVKYAWKAGGAINFTLAFEKHGKGEPYDEFLNGIENKSPVFYFIMGLAPEIFHFNTETVLDNETHLIFRIKFEREED